MSQNIPPMTDEQAIPILEEMDGYYETVGCYHPDWGGNPARIILDGAFTREELLTVLHFHPENKKQDEASKNQLMYHPV